MDDGSYRLCDTGCCFAVLVNITPEQFMDVVYVCGFLRYLFRAVPAIISAFTGDIFRTLNIGTIMGAIGVAWFMGAAIGLLVGGAVFDMYNSYFIGFLVGAICMLMVTFFLTTLPKP